MKWFYINSAQMIFKSQRFAVVPFDLNIRTKTCTVSINNLWLLERVQWEVRRPSILWWRCEGSQLLVIYITVCRLNNLFILLKYFQKYLYLSSFKTTTFLLLLKYFFWSILCTLLQVVFHSRNKTFTWLHFSSTFYTTAKNCTVLICTLSYTPTVESKLQIRSVYQGIQV